MELFRKNLREKKENDELQLFRFLNLYIFASLATLSLLVG